MQPLVTVVIPTLNRLDFLEETINSVINQTYKNLEILISDNGSDVSIVTKIEHLIEPDHRIRFRQNEKTIPASYHFNQCLDIANGKYFILLSDDDFISSNLIELMVANFEANPSVIIGVSKNIIIDKDGNILNELPVVAWEKKNSKLFIFDWLYGVEKSPVGSFISTFTRTEEFRNSGGYPHFKDASHSDNASTINLCLFDGDVIFINNASFFYRVYLSSFGLRVPYESLIISSKQFINYYKNDKNLVNKISQTEKKRLVIGIKKICFETFLFRLKNVYKLSNLRIYLAIYKYGVGFSEINVLFSFFFKKIKI